MTDAARPRSRRTQGPESIDPLRVAVLSCGELGATVADRLADLPDTHSILLLTAPYRHKERSAVERLIRSIRYDGVVDTIGGLLGRLLPTKQDEKPNVEVEEEGLGPSMEHRHVEAFDSPSALEILDEFSPDLGLVAGTYILPERVFDLPRLGSINLHMGKAPEYRGSAPAFWELYHGESSVGITVHEVTAELDAGRILRQESVPMDPRPPGDPLDYVRRFRSQTLEPAGLRLVTEAVSDLARDDADLRPQDEGRARYFPPPTRSDVWKLRLKVGDRRLRRRGADMAGRAVYATGLHRRMLADRAIVVLYHRVTERADGNPLACTPEDFERQCRFYERHFQVVGLGELLDRLRSGDDLSRCLAITFDDGYRDNYTVARPILERHGLPAYFFVATGHLGSNRVPRWDAIRGERPNWMSWEQVSDLLERGFEVGGHTRNHVDLGRVEGEAAYREIAASKEDIEQRMGFETPFFSYPYGGRDQISTANRQQVEDAGFECCLSAFGGAVSPDTDPFQIPRMAVSDWVYSPHDLGIQLVRE